MPPKRTKGAKPAKPAAERGLTKTQVVSELSTATGLTKSQVVDFISSLNDLIAAELKAGRPFTVPGIVKITLHHKAARPAREAPNPFSATKEMIIFKAKPAHKVIKVRPIKALKDLA